MKPIKVQIIKISDPQIWYKDKINQVFEVVNDKYFPHTLYVLASDKDRCIHIQDTKIANLLKDKNEIILI